MNVKELYHLPDSMKPRDVAALFEELLGECEQPSPPAKLEVANALDELSDRQWHTYERLDEGLRLRVESWIAANWDKTSLAFTQAITSIIPKLGLSGCLPLLQRAVKEPLPDGVREEILAALNEYGQNVDDPYAGIRKRDSIGFVGQYRDARGVRSFLVSCLIGCPFGIRGTPYSSCSRVCVAVRPFLKRKVGGTPYAIPRA